MAAGSLWEGRVAVEGIELFVRTVSSGPDVVVLHGGPGAHHDYLLPQFDALARGRRLRYYDQRGGGRSPAPRDADLRWPVHVRDLGALLDGWGLDRATLLGFSWGGLLAMLFATTHPARVSRLALVSPASASPGGRAASERRFAERAQAPALREQRAALQASGLRERDAEAYRQRAFELSVAAYFRDPASARDLTPFRVTARTQRAVLESLSGYDLRERLAALSVPALVTHGRHDVIPLESSREIAALLHADLVIFEHSGHNPHVEEFERFVAVLDRFLPTDR